MNTITTKDLNNTAPANKYFNEVYSYITTELPFDEKWPNGTGYFDGAQRTVKLDKGAFAKSFCSKTNRKLIMIGTRFSTVVVFERYTAGEDGVFVANIPYEIKALELRAVPDGRLGYDAVWAILGFWSDDRRYNGAGNISDHIERISDIFAGRDALAQRRQKITEAKTA